MGNQRANNSKNLGDSIFETVGEKNMVVHPVINSNMQLDQSSPTTFDIGYYNKGWFGEQYQRYAPNFMPTGNPEQDLYNLQQERYENQGYAKRIINFVPRTLGYIAGSLVQAAGVFNGVASIVNPISPIVMGAHAASSDDVAGSIWKDLTFGFDNPLVDAGVKFNEGVEKFFPNYAQPGYSDMNFGQRLGTTQFWLGEGSSAVGFFTSALLEGAGIGKALSSVATLARAGKIGSTMNKISTAIATANELALAGKPLTVAQKALTNLKPLIITAGNTATEAGVEAYGVKKQLEIEYENGLWGKGLTKDQADVEIAKRANATFLYNTAILALPNYWETSIFFKNSLAMRAKIARSLEGKNLGSGEILRQMAVGTGYESWQEGMQSATKRYETNLLNGQNKVLNRDNYEKGIFGGPLNIAKEFLAGFGDTDQQTGMFLGGIMGLVGGGVKGYSENSHANAVVKNIINYSNIMETVINESYKDLYKSYIQEVEEPDPADPAKTKLVKKRVFTNPDTGEIEYDEANVGKKAMQLIREKALITEGVIAAITGDNVHGDMVKATYLAKMAAHYLGLDYGDMILEHKLKAEAEKNAAATGNPGDIESIMTELSKHQDLLTELKDVYNKTMNALPTATRDREDEFNKAKLNATLYETAKNHVLNKHKDKFTKKDEFDAIQTESKKFLESLLESPSATNTLYDEWYEFKTSLDEVRKDKDNKAKQVRAIVNSETYSDKLLDDDLYFGETQEREKIKANRALYTSIVTERTLDKGLATLNAAKSKINLPILVQYLKDIEQLDVDFNKNSQLKAKYDSLKSFTEEKAKERAELAAIFAANAKEDETDAHDKIDMLNDLEELIKDEDTLTLLKDEKTFNNEAEFIIDDEKLNLFELVTNATNLADLRKIIAEEKAKLKIAKDKATTDKDRHKAIEAEAAATIKNINNLQGPKPSKYHSWLSKSEEDVDKLIVQDIVKEDLDKQKDLFNGVKNNYALLETIDMTALENILNSLLPEMMSFLNTSKKYNDIEKAKEIETFLEEVTKLLAEFRIKHAANQAKLGKFMSFYETGITTLLNSLGLGGTFRDINNKILALDESILKEHIKAMNDKLDSIGLVKAMNDFLNSKKLSPIGTYLIEDLTRNPDRAISLFVTSSFSVLQGFELTDKITLDDLIKLIPAGTSAEDKGALTEIFKKYLEAMQVKSALLLLKNKTSFEQYYAIEKSKLSTTTSPSVQQQIIIEQGLMYLSSPHDRKIFVINGSAGVGKTFLLEKLLQGKQFFISAAYENIKKALVDKFSAKGGTAFDINSIPILADVNYDTDDLNKIIEKVKRKLYEDSNNAKLYENKILVIDEAYALTRAQQFGLLAITNAYNTKMILLGDPNQKGTNNGLNALPNLILATNIIHANPLTVSFRSFIKSIAAVQELFYGKTKLVPTVNTTYNGDIGVKGVIDLDAMVTDIKSKGESVTKDNAIVIVSKDLKPITEIKMAGLDVTVALVDDVIGLEKDYVWVNISFPRDKAKHLGAAAAYNLDVYTALSRAKKYIGYNNSNGQDNRTQFTSKEDVALQEDTALKQAVLNENKVSYSNLIDSRIPPAAASTTAPPAAPIIPLPPAIGLNPSNTDDEDLDEDVEIDDDEPADNSETEEEEKEREKKGLSLPEEEEDISKAKKLKDDIKKSIDDGSGVLTYPTNALIRDGIRRKLLKIDTPVFYFTNPKATTANPSYYVAYNYGGDNYKIIGVKTFVSGDNVNVFYDLNLTTNIITAKGATSNGTVETMTTLKFNHNKDKRDDININNILNEIANTFNADRNQLTTHLLMRTSEKAVDKVDSKYQELYLSLSPGYVYLIVDNIQITHNDGTTTNNKPIAIKLQPGRMSEEDMQPLKDWVKELEYVTASLKEVFPKRTESEVMSHLGGYIRSLKELKTLDKNAIETTDINEIVKVIKTFISKFYVTNKDGNLVFKRNNALEQELVTLLNELVNYVSEPKNKTNSELLFNSLLSLVDMYYGQDTSLVEIYRGKKEAPAEFAQRLETEKIARNSTTEAITHKKDTGNDLYNYKMVNTSASNRARFYRTDDKGREIYDKEVKLKAGEGEVVKVYTRIINANNRFLGKLRDKLVRKKQPTEKARLGKHLTGGFLTNIYNIQKDILTLKKAYGITILLSSAAKTNIHILIDELLNDWTRVSEEIEKVKANPARDDAQVNKLEEGLERLKAIINEIEVTATDEKNAPLSVTDLRDLIEHQRTQGLKKQIRRSTFNSFAEDFNITPETKKQKKLDAWIQEQDNGMFSTFDGVQKTTVTIRSNSNNNSNLTPTTNVSSIVTAAVENNQLPVQNVAPIVSSTNTEQEYSNETKTYWKEILKKNGYRKITFNDANKKVAYNIGNLPQGMSYAELEKTYGTGETKNTPVVVNDLFAELEKEAPLVGYTVTKEKNYEREHNGDPLGKAYISIDKNISEEALKTIVDENPLDFVALNEKTAELVYPVVLIRKVRDYAKHSSTPMYIIYVKERPKADAYKNYLSHKYLETTDSTVNIDTLKHKLEDNGVIKKSNCP